MNIYNRHNRKLIIDKFALISYKLIKKKNLSEISKFKTIIVDNSKSDEIRLLVQLGNKTLKNNLLKYIKIKKSLFRIWKG